MSAWGQGSTRASRRAAKDCLDFYDHRCQLRHPGCRGHATQAHHVNSITAAGLTRAQAADQDLIAVCEPCHSIETEKQRRTGLANWHSTRRARRHRPHPGD